MNSKLKLLLKILGGLAVVLVLGAFAGFVYFIRSLPSKTEVAATLKDSSAAETAPAQQNLQKEADASVATAANKSAEDLQAQADSEESKEGFDAVLRILEEDSRVVHVCDQLGRSRYFEREEGETDLSFEELFSPNRDDSVAEALRIPVRAVLQDQKVASLIQEIHEVQESHPDIENKEGLFEKMGFYSKIAGTVAHLYANKANFEKIGNRAVHLSVIAKVAALKPEMAQNAIIQDFCHKVENSLVDNENINIENEREEILKMISYAGLTPEQVDFNPDQYIRFSVQSSQDKFSFSLTDEEAEDAKN